MKFNADIESTVKTALGLVDDETLVAAEEDVKEPMMVSRSTTLFCPTYFYRRSPLLS